MSKERLQELLDNILGWGVDHNEEFTRDLIYASGMTQEEAKELDVEEYWVD